MQKLALFGNPVSHSISPQLHQGFAEQCHLQIDYQKILTPIDRFSETIDAFRANGGVGANVTLPFKKEAFLYADQKTDRATLAGSVNMFIFRDGICIGDNTDGIGFLRDCEKKNIALRDKNILVLGAGGAAYGVIAALITAQVKSICIYNRTIENANICADFFKKYFTIEVVNSPDYACDVLINTTNQDFQNYPVINLHHIICYDLNYGERHADFVRFAKKSHAIKVVDGLGMLIEQAAESFFQWTGYKPVV